VRGWRGEGTQAPVAGPTSRRGLPGAGDRRRSGGDGAEPEGGGQSRRPDGRGPDIGGSGGLVDPILPSIGQPGVSPYAYVGKFDVYGDCPGWREYQGRVGRISLATTIPVSNPDILVGRPGMTWLYEIKPAANQLGEIVWGKTGKRGDNNAAQVMRYLWALAYAGYPNPQPGPNIVPASRSHPDGTITTIFSGVDWNKFAPKSARPDIRNAGIIYYITTKRPKVPSPKPVPVPVPAPVTQPVPQPTVCRRWFDHRRYHRGGLLHRRRRHPRRRPLVRRSWCAVQTGVLALTSAHPCGLRSPG
jgi:hypothetical protein